MKIIIAGTLIDGTGAPPVNHVAIHIDDSGRICDINPIKQTRDISNAEILDFSSYTILPGLIDSHTHLTLSYRISKAGKGLISQMLGSSPFLATLRAFVNLQEDLRSGVTTMRALGDMPGLEIEVRDAIERGEISGPRLLACVEIRPSHGAGTTAIEANGPWEIRKAVRQGISEGANVVKVFASNIRPGKDEIAYRIGDLTTIAGYSKEEIAAAVEEAHRAGVRVAVHALGGPALRWALEAGADTIEHANLMREEDIELFLKSGAYLSDPNLQLFFDDETGYISRPQLQGLPNWWHEKVQRTREQTRDVMRKALAAGVKFILGTDSNHGQLWREAKYFVHEIGATEMAAILSMTKYSALALGLENDLGTIEKGKIADLIAVEGNPLDDITCLRNVKYVIKAGQLQSPVDVKGVM